MARALEGVRVADFSHVLAGPFASYFLALLGAEVIKVESPGVGDGMRIYGPDTRFHGMSPNFIAANAGKKSIAIDLKSEGGLEVAKRLAASCDVVIENFRPGAMKRLGLGYDALKTLKPDLIYCAISGYGQSGPKRDYPAIDNIVQATSGMMSLSAGPQSDPEIVPFPVVDTYTATLAAFAIVTAILQKTRDGSGQFIDCAMLDSSMTLMSAVLVPYMITGTRRTKDGKRGYSGSPASGNYMAGDGRQISVGVVQNNQFEVLCEVFGRPDLPVDPRFSTAVLRLQNAEALIAILEVEFRKRDAETWEAMLSERGAACGVVRELDAAVAQPHLRERGAFLPLHVPHLPPGTDVNVINLGFLFEHDSPGVQSPPPRLGQDTDEILEGLGYDAAARERLVAEKAVARWAGPTPS